MVVDTQTPALILAGGRGTRLGKACDDCPKPMLPVAGKPFLEHVTDYLSDQGVRHFVFLTGHLGEQVETHFRACSSEDTYCEFVREESALGTGGAAAFGLSRSRVEGGFLLLNGDSFVRFSPQELLEVASGLDGAITAVRVPDAARYGALVVDNTGCLERFSEKSGGCKPGLINGGAYFLRAELFEGMSRNQECSLERDLFPAWLAAGRRFAICEVESDFLDIGTPESLKEAECFFAEQRVRDQRDKSR